MELEFEKYVITESKKYFGTKIGDVLAALQDLDQNKEGMGSRQLVANTERLINQLRRILHSNWSKREDKFLKQIQKIAVALARALEDKQTLPDIIPSASQELQAIMQKLGVPVNSLMSQVDGEEAKTGVADPEGQKQRKPPQKPQAAEEQPPGGPMEPPGQPPVPAATATPGQPSTPPEGEIPSPF